MLDARCWWQHTSVLCILLIASASRLSEAKLTPAYCKTIKWSEGRVRCSNYVEASSAAEKYDAAVSWRRYDFSSYACSGITANCLLEDMRYGRMGTECTSPMPQGSSCGDANGLYRCASGVCQAGDQALVDAQLRPDEQITSAVEPIQQTTSSQVANQGQVTSGSMTANIDVNIKGPNIPASFLGISHEFVNNSLWYNINLTAWAPIFAVLGPSPIIRIGGSSADALLQVPSKSFINSMVALHCAFGVRYIITIPLFQNNPAFTVAVKAAFDQAFASAPQAIVNYELGNEPDFWPTGQGGFIPGPLNCTPVWYLQPAAGYTPFTPQQVCYQPQTGSFSAGFNAYTTYFDRVANALTGCGYSNSDFTRWAAAYWPVGNKTILSGPGWGQLSLSTQGLSTIAQNGTCYLNETSVHYYVSGRPATIDFLLADAQINDATQKLSALVRTSQAAGIPLRVSESNSVSDGGQSNVSNVFGAALWTAQTAFEFAKAGASGINFHWGNGGIPENPSASPAYIGVQKIFPGNQTTNVYPAVRAPWYGYVLFSRAFANNNAGTNLFVDSSGNCPSVRMYAIAVPATGQLSVVLINKDAARNCSVTINVNTPGAGTGQLQRLLPGRQGLTSVQGITMAGQTYEGSTDGFLRGTFTQTNVSARSTETGVSYTVLLPEVSAALMVVPGLGLGQNLSALNATGDLVDISVGSGGSDVTGSGQAQAGAGGGTQGVGQPSVTVGLDGTTSAAGPGASSSGVGPWIQSPTSGSGGQVSGGTTTTGQTPVRTGQTPATQPNRPTAASPAPSATTPTPSGTAAPSVTNLPSDLFTTGNQRSQSVASPDSPAPAVSLFAERNNALPSDAQSNRRRQLMNTGVAHNDHDGGPARQLKQYNYVGNLLADQSVVGADLPPFIKQLQQGNGYGHQPYYQPALNSVGPSTSQVGYPYQGTAPSINPALQAGVGPWTGGSVHDPSATITSGGVINPNTNPNVGAWDGAGNPGLGSTGGNPQIGLDGSVVGSGGGGVTGATTGPTTPRSVISFPGVPGSPGSPGSPLVSSGDGPRCPGYPNLYAWAKQQDRTGQLRLTELNNPYFRRTAARQGVQQAGGSTRPSPTPTRGQGTGVVAGSGPVRVGGTMEGDQVPFTNAGVPVLATLGGAADILLPARAG